MCDPFRGCADYAHAFGRIYLYCWYLCLLILNYKNVMAFNINPLKQAQRYVICFLSIRIYRYF